MKKLISVAVIAASLAGTSVAQASSPAPMTVTSQPTSYVLFAKATGAEVSMASNMKSGGAKTGSATARFVVDLVKNTFCYTVTTKGLSGVVEAHIHTGAMGMDGADVIALVPAKFNKKAAACVKSTPALLGQIATMPANYYFNVHTKKFPDGAVRGQLAAGSK